MYNNQNNFLSNQHVEPRYNRRHLLRKAGLATLGAGAATLLGKQLLDYINNSYSDYQISPEPKESRILIKPIGNTFYVENSGMVFKLYESEPAKLGDGVRTLIIREWLRHAGDEGIAPVDSNKLRLDQDTINLFAGAERTYSRIREAMYSSDVKLEKDTITFGFDRGMIPSSQSVREGKSYLVPVPTKFKTLEEVVRLSSSK